MSENNYWLLPEGITEALPRDAQQLEFLRRELLDLYKTWGYQLVMPPLVEFMESLSTGTGNELDLQTFKLTDQESGRLMGLRADITPQVARIDAHRMRVNHPNRLCYAGPVLRTRSNHANGGSRSPFQIGAELFGHAGLDSDFEVMSLAIETVQRCGIDNIVLDLGHVGIFSHICKQLNFSQQDEKLFSDMLSRKSIPEIEQWVEQQGFSVENAKVLHKLPELNGSTDVLIEAQSLLSSMSNEVLDIITYLQQLSSRLLDSFPSLDIHIDLAELRGYTYHTGVLFQLYCPDLKREIIRGGRYDGIGKAFGNARPATGFSTDLRLLAGLNSHSILSDVKKVLAPADYDQSLVLLIKELRDAGKCVIRQLESDDQQSANELECKQIIVKQDGAWVVTEINGDGGTDG